MLPLIVAMKFTSGFLVWTLAINAGIAAMALWKGPEIYPDHVWVCYAVAVMSALAAGVCLVDLIDVDYGPPRALTAIFCHGMALNLIFAATYRALGLVSDEGLVEASFPTALYFSVVTWTTLGYGDFAPPPQIQLIAAFEAGEGLIFFGLFLGVTINWLNKRMT